MATITEVGTATSAIKYTGDIEIYIPKSQITYFMKRNSLVIEVGHGNLIVEFAFDDETQRNAAMVTLLGYF